MRSVSGPPPGKGSMLGGKQQQFLATKIVPPRCPGLIERPRLVDATSRLSEKRLAVVKGPAGFGKTSLAVTWLQRLQQSGNAVAWLTIDTDDDEPAIFLFYLAHALQHASEGVGAAAIDLIQESFLINPRAIVSTLMNDLADVDDEVYLFLEDYHWVANPDIHEALTFFLRRAPSHCHVVLTTRTEPPLPLASLRAQNQLLEIDASALRFDLQETRSFLEIESPGTLVPSDMRLLHEKTEGWPAALRIVASTSIQSRQDFAHYVRNLSGSQRPIGAYLEDMLDGLPRDMVQFMLRTAILDRLCAPLCEAVGWSELRPGIAWVNRKTSIAARAPRSGRPLVSLPSAACRILDPEVESELGNEIPGLHQRAALWYASQELWTDAVQHAIAAGDAVRALGWIENCAMPLVKRGDLFTLLGWQRLFPSVLMRSQPEVRLAIAWGMALAMRFDEALELAGEIERDNSARSFARWGRRSLRMRGNTLGCDRAKRRQRGVVIDRARLSQTVSGSVDCKCCLERCSFWPLKRGDLKKFYATPWIPYSLEDDRRNVFASVYYRCIQGMAEAQQLRIAAADRYYLDALRLAEQYVGPNSIAAALPASLIARIRYEQGRLDEAEAMLIDRVPLINAGAMLDCVLSAYFVMARIAVHKMNPERAHTLLERAENQGNTRGWGRLSAAAVLERARLCLDEGRIDEGAECLNRLERLAAEYPAPANCAWSDIHRYAALARAYVASAEQRFDDAISILSGLRREFDNVHNVYLALRVETHFATVKFTGETSRRSLGILRQCRHRVRKGRDLSDHSG